MNPMRWQETRCRIARVLPKNLDGGNTVQLCAAGPHAWQIWKRVFDALAQGEVESLAVAIVHVDRSIATAYSRGPCGSYWPLLGSVQLLASRVVSND